MIFYRVLITLLWLPLAAWLLMRVLRGKERLTDWAERTGFRAERATGPCLWLHAASNGELMSARPFIQAVQSARPGQRFVITTNSVTGRDLARQWDLPGLVAQLAPIDTRWSAKRLIRRCDVRGLIILESEFWPNRIATLGKAGLPVAAVGARMSRKSFRTWHKYKRLRRDVFAQLALVSAQDESSHRRMRRLGLAKAQLAPVLDLKAFYTPPTDLTPDNDLQAVFDRETTWLAASTHDGEDEIVLEAHQLLLEQWPEARLIIAPRHPVRGPDIARLARDMGFSVTLRSAGDVPRDGSVYIADTLGEMPLWYQLAATVFVGGSLVEKGGHTPFEPAAFDCTLLHGPYISNFTPIYRRLDVAGAAIQVSDARSLDFAILQVRDPERRATMQRLTREQLDQPADLDKVVTRVLELST